MSICCTDKTFIGCFNACLDINTGLPAVQTGNHAIAVEFDGVFKVVNVEIPALPADIVVPNQFNENAQGIMRITNPDGTTYTDGGFDCFEFRNNIIA